MNREVCFTVSKEFKILASFAADPLYKADPYWKIPKCCLNDKTILYKKQRNSLRKKSRERGTEKKRKGGRKGQRERKRKEGERQITNICPALALLGGGGTAFTSEGFHSFKKLLRWNC